MTLLCLCVFGFDFFYCRCFVGKEKCSSNAAKVKHDARRGGEL